MKSITLFSFIALSFCLISSCSVSNHYSYRTLHEIQPNNQVHLAVFVEKKASNTFDRIDIKDTVVEASLAKQEQAKMVAYAKCRVDQLNKLDKSLK
jgi:hypothetical protein